MWHPLSSPRAERLPARKSLTLFEQHRMARELARSYAAEQARTLHPALFLQPRAPSRPEAA